MTTTIPTLPRISDPANAPLKDGGALKQAIGPEMKTASLTLWEDGNGSQAGIWECTPGPSRWDLESHEFVNIISGRMTVTRDGEDPVDIGPGDSVLFEKGWQGTWHIAEKLRKLYVIF
jgi:hypothetical protein